MYLHFVNNNFCWETVSYLEKWRKLASQNIVLTLYYKFWLFGGKPAWNDAQRQFSTQPFAKIGNLLCCFIHYYLFWHQTFPQYHVAEYSNKKSSSWKKVAQKLIRNIICSIGNTAVPLFFMWIESIAYVTLFNNSSLERHILLLLLLSLVCGPELLVFFR